MKRVDWQRLGMALLVSLGIDSAVGVAAIAQTQSPVLMTDPLSVELDVRLLSPAVNLPVNGPIIRSDTISQDGMTEPSLWWTQEQVTNKLIDNWLAYTGSDGNLRRVDVVINPQVWSVYTYFERFGFISQMGTAAWDYGYNTRIFNRERELLAAYICQPGTPTTATESLTSPPCRVAFYVCESLGVLISEPQPDAPPGITYCREESESGGAPSRDPNPFGGR